MRTPSYILQFLPETGPIEIRILHEVTAFDWSHSPQISPYGTFGVCLRAIKLARFSLSSLWAHRVNISADSIWCRARSHGRLSSDFLPHDSLLSVAFTDLINNCPFVLISTSCMPSPSILEQLLLSTHPNLAPAKQK